MCCYYKFLQTIEPYRLVLVVLACLNVELLTNASTNHLSVTLVTTAGIGQMNSKRVVSVGNSKTNLSETNIIDDTQLIMSRRRDYAAAQKSDKSTVFYFKFANPDTC